MGMRSTSTYPDNMEDYEVRERGRPTIADLIEKHAEDEIPKVAGTGKARSDHVIRDGTRLWCGASHYCKGPACAQWVGDNEGGDCCHALSAMALKYLAQGR